MAAKPHLQIFICSTRPGRVGLPVADWFTSQARIHGAFDIEVVDLAEVNLPFMDEPKHPRLQEYEHEHTKRWSKTVSDYLHQEWQHKAFGCVSYGGVAAGTRAVQMLKLVLTSLKMMPLVEGVHIPFVFQHLSDGVLHSNQIMDTAAHVMLSELLRSTHALRPMRA